MSKNCIENYYESLKKEHDPNEIIFNVLLKLKENLEKNEIFLSEADFQFCFAQELDKYLKNEKKIDSPKIILEYPISNSDLYCQNKDCKSDRSFIDLYFEYDKYEYFIEFKYKLNPLIDKDKNNLNVLRYNRNFNIKLQGASNNGRFLIYEDIERMEKIRQKNEKHKSFVIFMTNDSCYWRINQFDSCKCFNYPLADPQRIDKKYEKLKRFTTKCKNDFINCDYPDLEIEYNYTINWNDFKQIPCHKNDNFRVLIIDCNSPVRN